MTTPEPTSPTPNPYQASIATVDAAAPVDRWRWLLAGVLGILGGYLTVNALTDGVIFGALLRPDSFDAEIVVPWVLRGVFALAVTALAFFAAPGAIGRRGLAVALFVVVTIVLFFVILGRLSGAIRGGGPAVLMLTNAYWVVLAVGGLGWLIASAARPIAYLSLLLALIVMPLNFVFAVNNLPSATSGLVQLLVSLVIAVVILFVSRPAAMSVVAAPAFDRWRWLLAGAIGIIGGYLTLGTVSGGLANVLFIDQGWETTVYLLLRGIFALAVTAFAFFVAPGTFGRRVLAVVLFVVISVALVAFFVGRLSGAVRIGGAPIMFVTNAFWVVLFVGGLGWLLAAGARPLAYLSLLLTFIVMPLTFAFTMNNIGYAISTTVQLVLAGAIAAVILLVSRPAVSYAAPAVAPAESPSASAAELAPTAFVAMEEGAEINESHAEDDGVTDAPRTAP
jgi:hypothetical protein